MRLRNNLPILFIYFCFFASFFAFCTFFFASSLVFGIGTGTAGMRMRCLYVYSGVYCVWGVGIVTEVGCNNFSLYFSFIQMSLSAKTDSEGGRAGSES